MANVIAGRAVEQAPESETLLHTPLGDCEIQVGSRTRVAVRFTALVVNGVTYEGSLRLIDYDGDGSFEPARDDGRTTSHYAVSMHRKGNFTDPTPAAVLRVKALLPPLVCEWARAHERALQVAEIEQLQANLDRIDDKLAQLRQELHEQEAAYAEARARLLAAKGKN